PARYGEELRILAQAQHAEPPIEVALEPVDRCRVEALVGITVEHLIEAVEAFDQEMQPALAVLDVEAEKETRPARDNLRLDRLVMQYRAVAIRIVDAGLDCPGVDRLGHELRKGRARRRATQRDDQLAHIAAYRSELE